MSAHLRLVSSTTEPADGEGDDWTPYEEGARFGEQIVRDAHAAGLCVPCWHTDGDDPRWCTGACCRNAANTEKENDR